MTTFCFNPISDDRGYYKITLNTICKSSKNMQGYLDWMVTVEFCIFPRPAPEPLNLFLDVIVNEKKKRK